MGKSFERYCIIKFLHDLCKIHSDLELHYKIEDNMGNFVCDNNDVVFGRQGGPTQRKLLNQF
jgi:hypothetical protein